MKGLMGCVRFSATLLHAAMIPAERASERAPEATIKGRSRFLASTTFTYVLDQSCVFFLRSDHCDEASPTPGNANTEKLLS